MLLSNTFYTDPTIKGDTIEFHIQPQIAWNYMNIFRWQGLVFYLQGKILVIFENAMEIDARFEYYAVDKFFYVGNGLYEVLFHTIEDRENF